MKRLLFSEDSKPRLRMTFFDILRIFFYKKGVIFIFTILITLLMAAIAYYKLQDGRSAKVSILNFTLMFDGINNSKYPNGTNFVDTDIIAVPILRKVYSENSLEGYYRGFENFKKTIGIERYNPGLAFLTCEYKTKLESQKLSSAERYELEQEFYRQTATMIVKPTFNLISTFPMAGIKYNIPDSVISKTLNDILLTWLEMAKNYQGITKYDISLLSNKIDKKFLDDVDYFNGVDFMRLLLEDLFSDVNKIEELPNAKLIKVNYGDKSYTLKDLKLRISYVKNYILTPLYELIRSANVYRDKEKTIIYLESQISNLNLQKEILEEKKNNYETLLMENYISSPEPIMKISSEAIKLNSELTFYKKFLSSLKYSEVQANPEVLNKVKQYQLEMLESENFIIDLIYKFYESASRHSLDSNASFYRINWCSSYIWTLVLKKPILKKIAAIWFALEIFMLLVIVSYAYFKEENLQLQEASEVKIENYLRSLPARSESLTSRKVISEKSNSLDSMKEMPK